MAGKIVDQGRLKNLNNFNAQSEVDLLQGMKVLASQQDLKTGGSGAKQMM